MTDNEPLDVRGTLTRLFSRLEHTLRAPSSDKACRLVLTLTRSFRDRQTSAPTSKRSVAQTEVGTYRKVGKHFYQLADLRILFAAFLNRVLCGPGTGFA